jgi:hypothetical protein
MAKGNKQKQTDGSTPVFETQLWAVAHKMRGRQYFIHDLSSKASYET